MKKMHLANRRRTRSGSGFEQINGECGGAGNPTVDKASEQSNTSVPLKTSETECHTPNNANENGHMHHEMMEIGKRNEQRPSPETGKKSSNTKTKFSGSHRELVVGLPCRGQFEVHRSRSASSLKISGGGQMNVLFSSHKRAQRSKEATASSSVDANSTPVNGPKKKKRTMKKEEIREGDEYTRIKKKLQYFLHRVKYEQNLIDAYSLEGWKGSSLEKLRPEKELERATKEILLRKVKIRDLFQHLDTLCSEGSFPESLFDSDGKISSEDIFCAKCGSKDLSVNNDIVLCDGFCDRGFHQFCVQPPLRKEDIPPDDESWLCPGCDCKDDCLDLLNFSFGTKFSVSDSWEKIFPEAAAALAGGGDQNLNCDLPSDDSDDEEYDPNSLNISENDEDGCDENEDSSSDESDFMFASDEMVESFKEGKDITKAIMALPSDDSEDDDYDPDVPTCDDDNKHESSTSNCTSDSEDTDTSSKGNESTERDEVTTPEGPGRQKFQLPYDAISESDAGLDDGLAAVPQRRNVERLDYKKLYDEEYENVPTSSSDDDDWDKTAKMGKEDLESEDDEDTVSLKQSSNAEFDTFKKPRQTPESADKKEVPQLGPRENGYSGDKSSSSASKKTDPRTRRLYKIFQENRYPEKATKESLAKELQMTITQVNNWFKNRRSSSSKPLVSKEDVEKSTEKEGEGGTSVAQNKDTSLESTTPVGSRKRRRQ